MTLDLDDAIRAVLDDLVTAAPDIDEEIEPQQLLRRAATPQRPIRQMSIAAAALVVVGIAGIAVVRSIGVETAATDRGPSTVASPADVVPTSVPETAVTIPSTSDVPVEMTPATAPWGWPEPPSWLAFQLAPAPVHIDLGVLDGRHVTIDLTETSLCVHHTDGSGCTTTDGDRPLDRTQYVSSGGSSSPVSAPPRFFGYWMTPADVVPTLLDAAGSALCEPRPTAIPALGNATLWTCQSTVDLFAPTASVVYRHGTETYTAP